MRALVQRVSEASVTISGEIVGRIGPGLVVLVGISRSDGEGDARYIADKTVNLRIFNDENQRMNRSLLETGGTLGLVSQFTLYGDARHGRRPSFVGAAPAAQAAPLMEALAEAARGLGLSVISGRFQAMMDVELVNAGPVTILLDTDKQF